MNQTKKNANIKRLHCDSYNQMRALLVELLMAYNFARWLKTLIGLTP
jgi:hypothetical protein